MGRPTFLLFKGVWLKNNNIFEMYISPYVYTMSIPIQSSQIPLQTSSFPYVFITTPYMNFSTTWT
jgi:hypothetical protein